MMCDKDKSMKTYTLDTLCPFPFDKSLDMPPFPRGVGLAKYEKYFGISDPQDHLRESNALAMEFMQNKIYIIFLFPQSLGVQAMEWFSRFPIGIKIFDEIANIFVNKYSHNIQHLVNIHDFCNFKKNVGEYFLTFLQWWQQLHTKYS